MMVGRPVQLDGEDKRLPSPRQEILRGGGHVRGLPHRTSATP